MVKKRIEIEIDIPDDIIDGELLELLPLLSADEASIVKGVVIGILMANSHISNELLDAISLKYRK